MRMKGVRGSWQTLDTEAEFLDVFSSLLFTVTSILTDFIHTPFLEQKWFQTGL